MEEQRLKILREDELEPKLCVVLGTRPGMIMFSPILRELERRDVPHVLVHTGQHYSYELDRQMFEELGLPEPAHKLEAVRHATLHGAQTAEMLRGCEEVFLRERPKIVLVGGDANSNLAGALAARKLHIRVGHVEAGERSYDWRMPEEHNRVLIDHMSEYLFATNEKGAANLKEDGVRGEVFVTGNPIVDATRQNLEIARRREPVHVPPFVAATVHREENTDSRDALASILEGMGLVAAELGRPVVFAVHPRTRKRMDEFGLAETAESTPGLVLSGALGYLDFLNLMASASLVLTDSGGVQQESCTVGVPCVTLRDSTEWTETVELGANALAGTDPARIAAEAARMEAAPRGWDEPFGDGHASERIVAAVAEALGRAPVVA